MRVEIVMPHMGQSMEEGRLVRWLKPLGASVERGEAIAEIETDKAVMDLESTSSGTLRELVVAEGDMATTGSTIAVLEDDRPDPTTASRGEAASERGALDGPSSGSPDEAGHEPDAKPGATQDERARSVAISPLARKLADAAGIDLADVPGSGPGGRIVKEDVESVVASRATAAGAAGAQAAGSADVRLLARSRIQLATARLMTASKQTAPHFYVTSEIPMDAALGLRGSRVSDQDGISVNDLILKAVASTLGSFPHLNATIADEEVHLHRRIDLAIAVAVPDGLVAPVIRDCATLSLAALSAAARGAIDRARQGRLISDDVEGGTFTVSNLGMFGVTQFQAIINPPQVAILAVGEVRRVAAFEGDNQLVPRQIITATVSADHRATDGAEVARFLQALREALADPESIAS